MLNPETIADMRRKVIESDPTKTLTPPAPFWDIFPAALTASVGYWATLSLNIPDFTRYARSQRSQMLGQALGLPTTMTAFAFIGVATTSATVLIFDKPIPDPVELVGKFDSIAIVLFATVVIFAAQLTTNMAANVVSPSNDFSNLNPKPHLLRHGRADHRCHRRADDALVSLSQRRGLYLHLAHRLFGIDGRHSEAS